MAAAPKTAMAWAFSNSPIGLSGASGRPESPPWSRIAPAKTIRPRSSVTRNTPRIAAVSSMWNQARIEEMARVPKMTTHTGIEIPVQSFTVVTVK